MANGNIFHGAARRAVSQDTVSQDTACRTRTAVLCAATLGVALAAGSAFAAASPVPQFIRHDIDSGIYGQVT